MGNMILIKDRHFSPLYKFTYALFGKYDTYKGSTLIDLCCSLDNWDWGKYDTYKGSTQDDITHISVIQTGKYDTYKESTHNQNLLQRNSNC